MTNLGIVVADFETQTSGTINAGDTSVVLKSIIDDDGVALSDGVYFFNVDGDSSVKEHFVGTLTASTKTLSTINSVSRQGVKTSGFARSHRIGAPIKLTDFATLYFINEMLKGNITLDSSNPLGYDGTPTLSLSTQIATKGYVDSAISGGVGTATNTSFGTVKLSVAAASAPNPIAVGDNDTRVPTQNENDALAGNSPSSANKYVTFLDTGISGANIILRLDGTGKLPAVDGSQLTGLSSSPQTLTAFESITAGSPIAAAYYQSDGGIRYDNSTTGNVASNVNLSGSITIGSNSNRIALVAVSHAVGTITLVTLGGVAMTLLAAASNSNLSVYYKIAPATGSNAIAIVLSTATSQFAAFACHSYYNVAQTGFPDSSSINTGTTTVALTSNPTADACLVYSVISSNNATSTYTGLKDHTTLTGSNTNPWQSMYAGDLGINVPNASFGYTLGASTASAASAISISIAPIIVPVYGGAVNAQASAVTGYSPVTTTTFRQSAFIGFALNTVTVGQTVQVQTGGVISNQSGLTQFKQYYLADAGGIQTTPGTNSRKVGIALTTTSLLITNIW